MEIFIVHALAARSFAWKDSKNGPCPIQEQKDSTANLRHKVRGLKTIKTPLYRQMTDPLHNDFWNCLGTSRATEVLHLAMLHPSRAVKDVFSSSTSRERLVQALDDYSAQAQSVEYKQFVP